MFAYGARLDATRFVQAMASGGLFSEEPQVLAQSVRLLRACHIFSSGSVHLADGSSLVSLSVVRVCVCVFVLERNL